MLKYGFKLSTLTLAILVLSLTHIGNAEAQNGLLTPKAIFARSKPTIVHIWSADEPRGTGFIISPEGIIATASHVITSRASEGTSTTINLLPDLEVQLSDGNKYPAKILIPLSVDSVSNDYALLQIQKSGLPFLRLGSWTGVTEGDTVTTLGFPLNSPSVLLIIGTVSGRFPFPTGVADPDHQGRILMADTLIFEGPANRGLSGSPLISNQSGQVVGIVTTKIVGIGPQLEQMQQDLSAPGQAELILGNVSLGKSTLALINLLDNYLISGMGSAVAIDPLKKAATPFLTQSPKREKKH